MSRLAIAVLVCGCAGHASRPPTDSKPAVVASNVWREDYAGSDECRYCHADLYRSWDASPMRNMTRHASQAQVHAPFDGKVFQMAGDTATVETAGDARLMRITTAAKGERLYRVSKVIGGRTREDFVGIEVTGAADPATDPGHGAEEILPISYVFAGGEWRYKGYSVMLHERPGLAVGPVWSQTCIPCHNTLPYGLLLLDDLLGRHGEGYQGTISDHFLPKDRLWRPVITDPVRLMSELTSEVTLLGGTLPEGASVEAALTSSTRVMRQRFAGKDLVGVGVGCESCHGGARAHADDPHIRPSFEPTSTAFRVEKPAGAPSGRAMAINRTCARCHTVLFSGYPYTWEGGNRTDPVPGGSAINSGEARDFLLGGCSGQMSCVACHDPHTADPPARLAELGTVRGNPKCLSCHPAYQGDEALRAHTHHAPDGEGSACLGCHMPKKNMGLAYELTRYHRIGSPDDPQRVERDRPLECSLCHPDRSVADLVGSMEKWWGRRFDRRALQRLYGDDLRANVLEKTLERGKPHEVGTAVGVAGERRYAPAIPWLVPPLSHEYPLVRFFARHALERITGERIAIDVNDTAAAVRALATTWLEQRKR